MPSDALAIRMRLHLTGCAGECVVHGVSGRDHVSEPFRYAVDFIATDVDLDTARGGQAVLELTDAEEHERFVHGVVEEISVSPTQWEDRHRYEAILVPEPSLLRYRHGFRCFQDLAVPDICRQVFARAGLDEQAFEWRLSARYEPRVFCVQYDESEWDFVSRLLEEEGIWYRFEHRADAHVMIFCVDSARVPITEPNPLPFDLHAHADFLSARGRDATERLTMTETRVHVNDYDRIHPSRDLRGSAEAEDVADREWYEHPGNYASDAAARRLAQARLDELRWPHHVTELATTAIEVMAGKRLCLAGSTTSIADAFVVSSELRIALDESEGEEGWQVANDLRLIPEAQPFRPPRRTPRPFIHGLQTARVTGPAGQDIHVDELGRVKVQLHWDRDAQLDERASCWVPVAQGHTTGAIMHPRIGWEVIVEFEGGNPDRPVVTGRVYNPFFPPPHALPERKTVSALRSDSLPGRQRINEVRFEDKAGDEHIAVTAGHDLREVTVVNRHVTVQNDENREVGFNRTELVGVLQKTVGQANHSDSVALFQNVFVGKDRAALVRRSASEQIQQNLRYEVGNMWFAQVGEEVPGSLQTMLRQSEEGPAFVVSKSLEELLSRFRDAAADEASEGASAERLLSETDPEPTYVLGPVMGSLTRAPDAPPDHSSTLGTSFGDTMGEVGREVGEVVEGVGEVVEGVEKIVEAVGGLADGVDSVGEVLGAVGGIADGLGGLTEGVVDVAGGLEGFGDALGDASFLQDGGFLEDVAGFLGDLGDSSGEVRRAGEQVADVTEAVGAAAALAENASALINDPSATSALRLLRGMPGSSEPTPDPSESTSSKENPLAFLDDVMGEGAGQTAWDVTEAVVGNIDSIIAGVSGLIDGGTALVEAGSSQHPYEHNSVHFAAAVADAIVRGCLSEEEADEEGDDEQEGEGEEEEHPPRGEGTWSFIVGGNEREQIAGVSVLGCGEGFRLGVGGQSREVARLARLEQIGDHRIERTTGAKTESTGRYVVVVAEGAAFSTNGAGRFVVSGDATVEVGGSQTLESGGDLELGGQTVQLDAAETITFECGAARITISSDGIAIEGTEIVIRGGIIGVDSPALG